MTIADNQVQMTAAEITSIKHVEMLCSMLYRDRDEQTLRDLVHAIDRLRRLLPAPWE